MPIIIII